MKICKLKSSAIVELLSEKFVFCNNDRFKVTNCRQTQYKGNFQKTVLQRQLFYVHWMVSSIDVLGLMTFHV